MSNSPQIQLRPTSAIYERPAAGGGGPFLLLEAVSGVLILDLLGEIILEI